MVLSFRQQLFSLVPLAYLSHQPALQPSPKHHFPCNHQKDRFVFSHPLFRPFSWRHTPICKTRQIGPWARRDGSRAREASRDLARFVSLVLLRALVRLRSADYSLRTSYVYLPLSFSPGPLWSCLTFSLFSDIPLAHAFDHQSLSSSQVRQCRWVAPVRVRRGERKSGCTQGHGLAVKRQPGS